MDSSFTLPANGKQIRLVTDLTEDALRDGFTQNELLIVDANGGDYQVCYAAFLRQFILKFGKSFPVDVDYSKSLAEMISLGKYDWVNDGITADHFPVKGEGQQEMVITLFHFNRRISSENAISEMDKAKPSFRPANPFELLALGAAQPEMQRQFPIIALGQIRALPGRGRDVVVLDRSDAERLLLLNWYDNIWDDRYRFAAFRK